MHYPPIRPGVRYLVIRLKTPDPRWLRLILLILACVSSGFWLGHLTTVEDQHAATKVPEKHSLYLLEEAATWVGDTAEFAVRVKSSAAALKVPPSWIMAVIYAESGFNPAIRNHRGSGATGLIQFMTFTAAELGYDLEEISQMNAIEQMKPVEEYFDKVKHRYGRYQSLTDFYLAVLFPKARNKGPCYTLYARPALAYRQNKGLDENRDGKVTVFDVDRRLLRLFPQAYTDIID